MNPTLSAPQLSFNDVISRHGKCYAERTAVVCGSERLTWREFNRRTCRVANAFLHSGLRKGDKVALFLPNCIETLELIVGIVRAGGVVVPLNTLVARDALARMISNADPKALVADATTAHHIEAIRDELPPLEHLVLVGGDRVGWVPYESYIYAMPDTEPQVVIALDDTFNIIYSSGTTGAPKGIEHTHFARLTYCLGFGLELGFSSRATTILTTPLYANGTWMTMMPTLFCGGGVVIMRKFDGKGFLEDVQQHRCTHAFMVPTQFIVTIGVPELQRYNVDSLTTLICSGSPLSARTLEDIGRTFASASLYEIYGMSEGFSTCIGPAERAAGKAASVGLPILDGDIRILSDQSIEANQGEIGEVVGYSSSLMKGYYRDIERTREMIWKDSAGRPFLRSGDLGKVDDEGYLYIVGRKKDMIISGGVNIFAVDLEEVFMRHPEVQEVAAIGVPHPKWGETPLLFAIMKPGAGISAEQLRDWGNERLAKFQRVARVQFCEEFPRNALGKILKRELRDAHDVGRDVER